MNGELAEVQSGSKAFVFKVALKDGSNIIVAEAGGLKDSMTLEKVETEPAIYTLPEVNERWFGQRE